MRIILASQSSARKKLLIDLGLKFEIIPSNIDEEKIQDPIPSKRVKKIACQKAKTVFNRLGKNPDLLVIAADTFVYCNKMFIGKPKSKDDAKKILSMLSNSKHHLYSGICIIHKDKIILDYEKSTVHFRYLTTREIDLYVQDPEVLNHAGAYTIEKTTAGEGFIKKLKGSYSNVLGLPMEKLEEILKCFNLEYRLPKSPR